MDALDQRLRRQALRAGRFTHHHDVVVVGNSVEFQWWVRCASGAVSFRVCAVERPTDGVRQRTVLRLGFGGDGLSPTPSQNRVFMHPDDGSGARRCEHCEGTGISPLNPHVGCGPCKGRGAGARAFGCSLPDCSLQTCRPAYADREDADAVWVAFRQGGTAALYQWLETICHALWD